MAEGDDEHVSWQDGLDVYEGVGEGGAMEDLGALAWWDRVEGEGRGYFVGDFVGSEVDGVGGGGHGAVNETWSEERPQDHVLGNGTFTETDDWYETIDRLLFMRG